MKKLVLAAILVSISLLGCKKEEAEYYVNGSGTLAVNGENYSTGGCSMNISTDGACENYLYFASKNSDKKNKIIFKISLQVGELPSKIYTKDDIVSVYMFINGEEMTDTGFEDFQMSVKVTDENYDITISGNAGSVKYSMTYKGEIGIGYCFTK